ncbi:aminotransferase class I/II-fold pyridoxal phosphate-dependent enzyme [Methylobrevis albus]|uniref:Aminotransferase class I/II-fold pyridoxal phosphate-dependent enzyme n=1 Tax=Methylobrevis albus TaxID=2793297 RepID=A0A931MXB6_9HYPH|nr:aminotransferase class I/II-fold pyridoxal phosphate-dependent enzyme [Methylobrevis albus]MBH0236605.1 aminotransferase class I/II-fold pyridoxal phosphate-dependent enzyme [Methylobrevis albus]
MVDHKRGFGGVSGSEKAALVAGLREATRNRKPKPVADLAANPPRTIKAYDFAKLDAYRELRMQRAAADMMGIANPFFRAHDGIARAETSIGGKPLLNFASYNYLGLNGHPRVVTAAKQAIDRYGTTVSASRLVAGERPIHRELEHALASLHGVEDAIVMVSGHATNVSTIGTLLGPKDLILYDSLIHNSIAEGARLSGAARLSFPHNDWRSVAATLEKVRHDYDRVLIAIEGLYSMDGDMPDLAKFIEVKAEHDAWLLVDEAHSLGVLGATGRGIAEHAGIDPASVEMWMGTLSKTLSGCGGYIAGSSALVEFLKVKAPGFVYSVGLAPALAAAAIASIEVMLAEPERVSRLRDNGLLFLDAARAAGLDVGLSEGYAVVPVIVGGSAQAAVLADSVFKRGLNALPIIYPAVPEKSARLRFFITSDHSEADVRRAVAITAEEFAKVRSTGSMLRQMMGH